LWGLAWLNNPERCAASVLAATATHAGQVKGDIPDKDGYSGLTGWGLGVGLVTSSLHKETKRHPRLSR